MHARLVTTTAALLALSGLAWADQTLTILHTNDFHARFEPISKYDSGCGAEDNAAGKCFGGTARLATAIAEARAAGGETLLVDAGDQFQGTLFYTRYRGQVAAEMMARLGYDAMAVGNHEFDNGPEVLGAFADAAGLALLGANLDVSGAPALAGRIAGATVLSRGGVQIGLVGLTPEDTAELSAPGPGVAFGDALAAARAEVAALEAQGITRIVVLSHLGYGRDLALAAAVPGIDVIVGGHSHTYLGPEEGAAGPYPTMVGETAIVTAYGYGKYLGALDVTFDDAGRVVAASGAARLMDASVAEDPAILARLGELAQPLEELRARVIGEAATDVDGQRSSCRYGECAMGNLVTAAMLDRVAGQGITIALTNGGGLRASIDAGPVTMGEVLTVLPFQNTLATFRLSGADLLAALENGLSQVEQDAGRFPQVAGLRLVWDGSAAPGARVVSAEVAGPEGWGPLDPAAVYGVVSNNYMRAGGDGYGMLATAAIDAYDYGPNLEVVLAEYIAANGTGAAALDGRIRRAD